LLPSLQCLRVFGLEEDAANCQTTRFIACWRGRPSSRRGSAAPKTRAVARRDVDEIRGRCRRSATRSRQVGEDARGRSSTLGRPTHFRAHGLTASCEIASGRAWRPRRAERGCAARPLVGRSDARRPPARFHAGIADRSPRWRAESPRGSLTISITRSYGIDTLLRSPSGPTRTLSDRRRCSHDRARGFRRWVVAHAITRPASNPPAGDPCPERRFPDSVPPP